MKDANDIIRSQRAAGLRVAFDRAVVSSAQPVPDTFQWRREANLLGQNYSGVFGAGSADQVAVAIPNGSWEGDNGSR